MIAVVRNRIRAGEEAVIFATGAQVAEARAWLGDCSWADLEREEIAELTAQTVVRGVDEHYAGGWAGFLAAFPDEQEVTHDDCEHPGARGCGDCPACRTWGDERRDIDR